MGYTLNREYQKSLLDVYSVTSQTIGSGQVITYPNINIDTGCSIEFAPGTSSVQIVKPGVYQVEFEGVATAEEAGVVTIQIQRDGVNIPAATASVTYANTTNLATLNVGTLIKVLPSCCAVQNHPVITIVNTGVGTVFNSAKLIITKLC